jgi:transposase-like protein
VEHFLNQKPKSRLRANSNGRHSGSPGKVKKKRSCTRWTEEENKRLIEAYVKYDGKNWSEIAKEVGNKTSDQCNQHWHRVLNPAISKSPWTGEEDRLLITRVQEFGESSWKKISEGLQGRTDLQCRHRWTQIKKTMVSIF